MAPGVHVERIEVASLDRASHRCAEIALGHRGGARKTLLLAVGLGPRPGLRVAPWILHAAVTIARETSGPIVADAVEPRGTDAMRRQLRALGTTAPAGDRVALLVPGARHPVHVPADWIGAHACLLIPCVRDATVGTAPVDTALATLAAHTTREALRDPAAAGRWLVEHVFATVGVVLDASWSVLIDGSGEHLRSSERVAACASLPTAALDAVAATWNTNGNPVSGLAARRVGGLWRKDPRDLLVPGALAQSWHAYPRTDGVSSR